jgi:hypothetical protein
MKIQIESDTTKGKYYTVDTIKLTCTCLGYKWNGFCKHIKKALTKLNKQQTKIPDSVEEKG